MSDSINKLGEPVEVTQPSSFQSEYESCDYPTDSDLESDADHREAVRAALRKAPMGNNPAPALTVPGD